MRGWDGEPIMITDRVRKIKTFTVQSPDSPSRLDACIRDAESEIMMVAYNARKELELEPGDIIIAETTLIRQRDV